MVVGGTHRHEYVRTFLFEDLLMVFPWELVVWLVESDAETRNRHWHWPGTGTGPAPARHWLGTGTGPALTPAGTGPYRHWPGTGSTWHWHWPGTGTGPTGTGPTWRWHWRSIGTGAGRVLRGVCEGGILTPHLRVRLPSGACGAAGPQRARSDGWMACARLAAARAVRVFKMVRCWRAMRVNANIRRKTQSNMTIWRILQVARGGKYPEYPRGAVEYRIESKTRDVDQFQI